MYFSSDKLLILLLFTALFIYTRSRHIQSFNIILAVVVLFEEMV